jgi:hypothetical protein
MRSFAWKAALVVLALTAGKVARAQDDPPQRTGLLHYFRQEGTPPPGKPRSILHTDERAGFPRTLSWHVQPSNTPGGIGYYVGGGVPLGHGQSNRGDEGTWGWDETGGSWFRNRGRLLWSHGRRYQGGTGAYKTDDHPLPDAFATVGNVLINRRGRNTEHLE